MRGTNLLDRVGSAAGTLCAIHCFALGAAAAILPFVSLGFLSSPWLEGLFVGIAFVVGPMAWYNGFSLHKCWYPGAFLLSGLALLVMSHFIGHNHGPADAHHHSPLGAWISVAGGVCIVTFHVMNSRYIKRHGCGHSGCEHAH